MTIFSILWTSASRFCSKRVNNRYRSASGRSGLEWLGDSESQTQRLKAAQDPRSRSSIPSLAP